MSHIVHLAPTFQFISKKKVTFYFIFDKIKQILYFINVKLGPIPTL